MAQTADQPADQWHGHGRGQQKTRGDPFDLISVYTKGTHHAGQRHINDTGIQDRHERAAHDDAEYNPTVIV